MRFYHVTKRRQSKLLYSSRHISKLHIVKFNGSFPCNERLPINNLSLLWSSYQFCIHLITKLLPTLAACCHVRAAKRARWLIACALCCSCNAMKCASLRCYGLDIQKTWFTGPESGCQSLDHAASAKMDTTNLPIDQFTTAHRNLEGNVLDHCMQL